MTEAIIAVAALVVGFGLGFLVRGASQPKQVRRKKPKHGERRAAPSAGNGSSERVRGLGQSSEVDELLESIEETLADASESLADVRARWLEEGEDISKAGRAALDRFDTEVHTLEEELDRLESEVGADDPAHARLDAALNELFAAARRLAPYGQGDEADARDREALESHEHRFATARADFEDAAAELRSRSRR